MGNRVTSLHFARAVEIEVEKRTRQLENGETKGTPARVSACLGNLFYPVYSFHLIFLSFHANIVQINRGETKRFSKTETLTLRVLST